MTGMPRPGHVVEVWHLVTWILAVWDGKHWKTTDGAQLDSITHWRERP